MKKLIFGMQPDVDIEGMARICFIPIGSEKSIEVYVNTDDGGQIPHFHVRKYGSGHKFEWETCIRYDKADYFLHGKYTDKLPTKKIAKQLDQALRQVNKKSRNQNTYWEKCIDEWNDNNSSVELDLDLVQPDYTKLSV